MQRASASVKEGAASGWGTDAHVSPWRVQGTEGAAGRGAVACDLEAGGLEPGLGAVLSGGGRGMETTAGGSAHPELLSQNRKAGC